MAVPQNQESLGTVPVGFLDEVHQASADQQAAKLILLGIEAKGTAWEPKAISLIQEALVAIPAGKTWDRVILFTGHRVDSADRKTPRFPADKEQVARVAIRRAVEEQRRKSSESSVLGVSGGANGGDLLFIEICDELGINTEMGLALPLDQYVKTSVEGEDPSWVHRFDAQLARHANVPILAVSPELPTWLQFKKNYDIWQRNNLWLLSEALSHKALHRTLIALWDGEIGDGPGGTEHMVSLAKERAAEIVWLNTKQLFGLDKPGR